MKKIISILLAVALLASLGVAALAEERTEEYEDMGINVTYPESFDGLKGVFYPYMMGKIADGVFIGEFLYFAMPEEDFERIMESAEPTEEEIELFQAAQNNLGYLIALSDGVTVEDLSDMLGLANPEDLLQIGAADSTTWYFIGDELIQEGEAEYTEEFHTLQNALPEVLAGAEFYAPPIFGAETVGQTASFETTDTEGNPVSSKDLFAQHEITMVNCWASWCGPCVGELAELVETNKRLAESDCAIIGVLTDGDDEEALKVGMQHMEENGVDYPVLIPNDDVRASFNVRAYPTTYFVNREGVILCAPMEGAPADLSAPNEYEKIIASLLAGEEVSMPEKEEPVSANSDGVYRVIVRDADSNPVEGVAVQFCDDNTCMMAKTDADGVASYEVPEGSYTVHILKVPEGYVKTNDEFKPLETYSDVFVVLEKAA